MGKTIPRYALVEKRIGQAIRQRVIVDKLPGERVLAKEFGVLYMTLRKAVENLCSVIRGDSRPIKIRRSLN